ncbi:hypothetical protein [Streptomyces prunicolor]
MGIAASASCVMKGSTGWALLPVAPRGWSRQGTARHAGWRRGVWERT